MLVKKRQIRINIHSLSTVHSIFMRILLSILALFVIAEWAIVHFKYNRGGFFHLPLVVAIFALVVQWFPNKNGFRSAKKKKNQKFSERYK